MARWLAAAGDAQQPAFAAISGVPEELANHANTICAADLRGGMNLPGGKQALSVLKHLSAGSSGPIELATRRTLGGIALIDGPLRQPDGKVAPYQPAGGAITETRRSGAAWKPLPASSAWMRAFAPLPSIWAAGTRTRTSRPDWRIWWASCRARWARFTSTCTTGWTASCSLS
jgi:hypothetical protein